LHPLVLPEFEAHAAPATAPDAAPATISTEFEAIALAYFLLLVKLDPSVKNYTAFRSHHCRPIIVVIVDQVMNNVVAQNEVAKRTKTEMRLATAAGNTSGVIEAPA